MTPANFRVLFADGELRAQWDAGSVADPFSVLLEFLDENGAALKEQPTVNYGPGQAVLARTPAVGERFHVRARLVSPFTPAQNVIIHAIGGVTDLSLDWHAGALHARWTAPAGNGSFTFRVLLLDTNAQPINPQPPVTTEGATEVAFAGSALTDLAVYKVSVQAELDGSLGPLAISPPWTINKSFPDSLPLRALLARLQEADRRGNHAFALTPELVQAENATGLFGNLLNQPNDALSLGGTRIGSSPASVDLAASSVDLPFATGKPATLTFTDVGNRIELSMTVAELGSFQITDLIAKKIIPYSVFDPAAWAAGLGSFPQLSVTLDSRERALSFTGPPTVGPWAINIGLAGVGIGPVTPAMRIAVPEAPGEGKQFVPHVRTELAVSEHTRIPVLLRMPSGLDGWRITLGDPSGAWLGDVSNLNAIMAGANSGLPAQVIGFGNFRLTQLRFAFLPSPDTWNVRALLTAQPTAVWNPIGDSTISIREITAGFDLDLFNVDGTFRAQSKVFIDGALAINDTLTIGAGIWGPNPEGLWTLSGSASAANFRLADLARYTGGDASPLSDALAQLGRVGSLSLTDITVRFGVSDNSASLRSLSVNFEVSAWTIPALPWFTMDQIVLGMDVQNPTQSSRIVTGSVRSLMTLGSVQVEVDVDFSSGNTWHLQLAAFAANLSGLQDISDVLPAGEIASFLPDGLKTSTDFGLGGFSMTYNAAESFIAESTFDLDVDAGWTWLNGLLTLWSISLHLRATRAGKEAAYEITGSVSGTVELGGAVLDLKAEKKSRSDPWSFHGGLAEDYTLDFDAALAQIGSGLRLPSGYGVPASITVLVADLTFVPATGQLDFYSQGTADWSFAFGQTTMTIDALGGELHIPGGAGATTGKLNGDFTIGGVRGLAMLALGKTDTVISVQIEAGEQPGAAEIVNSVAGGGSWQRVDGPAGFIKPASFTRAALSVNLTKSRLLLTGEYAGDDGRRYAGVALLVAPRGDGRWGYVLAGALNRWTLTDISPALSGVDAVLGIAAADAAIALSLLDGTAGAEVAAAIPAIGGEMVVMPGLNFFGRLNFAGGWLENLAQIVSIQGAFTISGNIPPDETRPVTFKATMGDLRLLGTFAFQQAILSYTRTPAAGQVAATNDLRVTGTIVARLDKDYSFSGDLHLTSDMASFQAATTNSVHNPLGIPGITLDALGFNLRSAFVSGKATGTVTTFCGQVSFANGLTLAGFVGLSDGVARLVLVKLAGGSTPPAELSIGTLFHQTTGLDWPDVLDIVLSNGELWYVPGASAVTYQSESYVAGFHASADVTLFSLPKIRLAVEIDGDGTRKGLGASAQFAAPIDWSFIRFTGARTQGGSTTGPFLTIDTRNGALPFTLGSSIILLGSEVGDVTIQVRRTGMTGTLTLPESAGVFRGSSLTFEWDDKGFRVKNWPLRELALPKFDLENLKGEGACSQVILDLLPIDSRFNLDVSFSIQPPLNGPATLDITLNGTFDLAVTSGAYRNDPLLRANVVNATARIPFPSAGGYDWDKLRDGFVGTIKQAGESIVQNLLRNAKNVAKLSAVAGAKWAIASAIEYLVCRGLTVEAAEAAVAVAASAESGTVAACGGATVAAGGVVASIVAGVVTNQESGPDQHKPRPGKPGKPMLSFLVDSLRIGWPATDVGNTAAYAIAVEDENGNHYPVSAVTNTGTSIPASALKLGRSYTVRIIAAGPGGQSDPGDPATLYLLTAPDAPTPAFNDPDLTVTWSPVAGAGDYAVKALDALGVPVPNPRVSITGMRAVVQAQAFESGGAFKIQVQALAPDVTGPWSAAAGLTIAVLDPPKSLAAVTAGASVRITWQPVPGAAGYAGAVTNASGQAIDASIAIQGETAILSGAAIIDGAHIQVTIKAAAPNSVGRVSAPLSIVVNAIPAPVITGHLYRSGDRTLLIDYTVSGRASKLEFEILDNAGHAVTPAETRVGNGHSELAMSNPAQGAYTLRMRGVSGGDLTEWSASVTVDILNLEAPANVSVANRDEAFFVMWSAVPGAASYGLQVLDGDQPMNPQPSATFAGTSANVDPRSFLAGAAYQVEVRAEAVAVEGPYSSPAPFTWSQPTVWKTPGHDFRRTGRSNLPGPEGPDERWSISNLSFRSGSAAVVEDGTVITAALNFVAAFNPDGTERWRWSGSPPAVCYSPSVGADGSIYFGSEDHYVYALDGAGQLRWKYMAGEAVRSAPTIAADGTIYVAQHNSGICAIAADGSLKWTFGGGRFDAEMALAPDGTLYAGSVDNKLYAIFPDGKVKWTLSVNGPVNVAPVVGLDGTIHAGAASTFYAIHPDGTLKWQKILSQNASLAFSQAALGSDGAIYVHHADDSLYAFRTDGSIFWQVNLGPQNAGINQCPPAIDSLGTIFVGSENGSLFAIGRDGVVKWKRETGAPLRWPVVIGPGRTLYACSNDQLNAFGQLRITGVKRVSILPASFIGVGLAVSGNLASGNYLLVTGNNVLHAFDLSDRANPREIQSLKTSPGFRAVMLGNYLYAAGLAGSPVQRGLLVFDVSGLPGALKLVGSAGDPLLKSGKLGNIGLTSELAFVAAREGGVGAFSIADPSRPELTAHIPVEQDDSSIRVAVSNGLLYIVNKRSGLQIYRIDSPRSLVRVGGNAKIKGLYGIVPVIAAFEHFLLVTNFDARNSFGAVVIDVSNPAAPTQIATFRLSAPVLDITMMGRYAIATGGGMAAYVADLRDLTRPVQVGTWLIGGGAGYQIARVGTYLYVSRGGELWVMQLQLENPL